MKKSKKIIGISVILLIVILITCLFNKDAVLQAYYTSKDNALNNFAIGKIEAKVEEPDYDDGQVIKPNQVIVKNPKLSNSGEIASYIRAQVYVPITNELKYVDENENIVVPGEEIETVSYKDYLGTGWEKVTDDGFSGVVQDKNGNKYKVYTYKYMENGKEKIIESGEGIDTAVFDHIKVINYLDNDTNINIKVIVKAIAIQAEGGTADEMWTYYKNQNKTGIVGVN